MLTSGESPLPLQLSSRLLGVAYVVSASGDIDISEREKFDAALRTAIDEARSTIVIDLTGVNYIDSTGLNCLARAQRRLIPRNETLQIVLDNPHLTKVFEIVGFDRLFPIHRTLDDALAGSASAYSSSTHSS